MPLLYVACVLDKYYHPDIKVRKNFYGRWFVNLSEYFNWICFYPFVIVFLAYIACNSEIMDEIGITCDMSTQRIVLTSIVSFALILSLIN